MKRADSIVVFLVMVTASFMMFDGARALIIGDYITPSVGEYAGQLGPWAMIVAFVGTDPLSTVMKFLFIAYGIIAITMDVCFLLKFPWAKRGLLLVAILGLWYLPIGTVTNLIVVILLLIPNRDK